MVKKFRKRKELDKLLLGSDRKHFRKKSGHVLLRTDSQSSLSSDDLDKMPWSAIRYKWSRCSCRIIYASICLSICTLILTCVLFGLTFILRSHITELQSEIQTASQSSKLKTNELQEIYSRLQTLQVYVHHLNRNITKQRRLFRSIANQFKGLEKRFKTFESFEALLGSLSNVPSRLQEIMSKNDQCYKSIRQFREQINQAYQRLNNLAARVSSAPQKNKAVEINTSASNSTQVKNIKLDRLKEHFELLRRNVTEIRTLLSKRAHVTTPFSKSINHISGKEMLSLNRTVFNRLDEFETELRQMRDHLKFISDQRKLQSFMNQTTSIQELKEKVDLNKKSIASIQNTMELRTSVIKNNFEHGKQVLSPQNEKMMDFAIKELNSTLSQLVERLPNVKMTLGFGVSDNATFKKEPLGHGVILRRDEYFKLRSFWAKASNSFTLSVQSQQRVDTMEKKFKKLKQQVISAIKDINVLQAVGLKPTDKPGDKNRPEMEINVPVPVYTTARNPSAPTPDPHLKLPWVKTARDAEINFLRWNRNGDDALSGDELDPAALRGFMGPYTPTLEQMMHFDVNNDHRLSKKEILCLFGYIQWPCTGEVVSPTAPVYGEVAGKTTTVKTSGKYYTSKSTGSEDSVSISTLHSVLPTASSTVVKDALSNKASTTIPQSEYSEVKNSNSIKSKSSTTSYHNKLSTARTSHPTTTAYSVKRYSEKGHS